MPEPEPGHWIERGPQKRLMVFAGRSHPELAQRIAEQLGVELGEHRAEHVRERRDLLPLRRVDPRRRRLPRADGLPCRSTSNLMELLLMIQAAKLASAKRITAVIPWFPYSRQDRKAKPREPISGRFVADMLQLAGADRVLTMDLHAGQIQGFFAIPVDHMTALPLFARHFRDLGLHGEGVVSVCAGRRPGEGCRPLRGDDRGRLRDHAQDAAGARRGRRRPRSRAASRGKVAIVGDDMITTGGTLLAGAQALKEHGATDVWVFATHGLFCGDALERFGECDARRDRRHGHGPDRPASRGPRI